MDIQKSKPKFSLLRKWNLASRLQDRQFGIARIIYLLLNKFLVNYMHIKICPALTQEFVCNLLSVAFILLRQFLNYKRYILLCKEVTSKNKNMVSDINILISTIKCPFFVIKPLFLQGSIADHLTTPYVIIIITSHLLLTL